MKTATETADGREIILARIREAATAVGARGSLPMPAHEGRNGLPPGFADLGERASAFARRMEELRVSFVLCDTTQDVSDGLAMLALRSKWKSVAVQESPCVRRALSGMDPSVACIPSGEGKARLGSCDAGVVECLAMDAQTGAILVGSDGGALEVTAVCPTLVIIGSAGRLAGTLDEAFRKARTKGELPAGLTLLSGGAVCYGVERRPVAKGHGPTNIIAYLAISDH